MTSLLRTTALASVLALAAPYALAGDAKHQADFDANAKAQSAATGGGVTGETATAATAADNVDLMAQFERLRMLDPIGNVEVVKLQPGELPASAEMTTGAASNIDSEAVGTTGGDAASRELATSELDATADDRISSGFEAGATVAAPEGEAAELDDAADAAAGADTGFEAGGQTQVGAAGELETDSPAEAGALFGESEESVAGVETDTSQHMAAGSGDWQSSGDAATTGDAAISGDVSATFIEDTVSQMPEVNAALEEADAEPADIVQVDIGDSGDVTIYVR